ncbi:uncharacterized protein psda isoform X2 [Salvelinus fontinalis]|uniref:uncharacterized protein psda isoform X2 n=1 Tax=Salvelinus fontinalis TaxID=8038 RepID=UPI0024858382|nr:uncharacterized protein psda isoform X2 [Salvelinus fontinalis]
MSQSGKILHLYVEVRSVPEEEEERKELGGGVEGIHPLVLQEPDILPQSQRTSSHSTCTCTSTPSQTSMSPGVVHNVGGSSPSLTPSKSSSRHSVSFQLDLPDNTGQHHRQSLPYEGTGQLLSTLQPAPNGPQHGTLVRTRSSDIEHYHGRVPLSPASSGIITAPSPPTSGCRFYNSSGVGDEGKRSVVSFSYIEKASIKSVDSPCSALCQSIPENPFSRGMEERYLPAHLRKRLSDPVWSDSWQPSGSSSPKLSPKGSPCLRRATLDTVAREATYRAMEEFGSPELRRRLAAYSPDQSHSFPPHYQQQLRCKSWVGSPVLPQGTKTLPVNPHLIDPDRNHGLNGLTRSPASDQLFVQARQSYYKYTMSPSSVRHHYGVHNHRPGLGDESPSLSSKFRPPLPTGRPTAIQHDIPASMSTSTSASCNQRTSSQTSSHTPSDSHCLPNKVNSKPSDQSNGSKLGEGLNQTSGSRSIFQASSPDMARKLAAEVTKLPNILMDRRTPSPTPFQADSAKSESPRPGYLSRKSQPYTTLQGTGSPAQPHPEANSNTHLQDHRWTEKESPSVGCHSRESRPGQGSGQSSPLLRQKGISSPTMPAMLHPVVASSHTPIIDPRLQRAELVAKDSPTLHRHQPPQYMGDRGSPGLYRRQYDTLFDRGGPRDSPESSRRLVIGLDMEPPDSWTSRMQQWRENVSVTDQDESNREDPTADGDGLCVLTKEELMQQGRDEGAVLGDKQGVNRGETQDHSGLLGSSQSSSGVTGSLEENSQQERDCLSPETSSQSSQKSNDTASGMQSDSHSSVLGPSLHSQRIAHAKWEFLFGQPTEDCHDSKDSTAPPRGTSSESPKPTPPSSLPLKPTNHWRGLDDEEQSLSYHNVQQVEVELVTPPLVAVVGISPKTGIIRKTIKYSETDLDAVPLKCYRETDLDEVMLAEAEAQAEREREQEEVEVDSAFGSNRSVLGTSASSASTIVHTDGEVEELEEEVVSWASVRMQGDKKRQHATHEDNQTYSLLMKGRPLDYISDSHSALKSPISLTSPRRISADGLDSFSHHFESIVESHRAKGTSYSSLDSVDLLTSSGPPVFTFDLPTLTPEIQSQICESARHITELSFAPLAHPEPPRVSVPVRSENTLAPTGDGLSSYSEDSTSGGKSRLEKDSMKTKSNLDFPLIREKPGHRAPDPFPQQDVGEHLVLGSTESLANGNKADLQAAKRLAKRLFNLDGFRKSDVARHLSKNNEFSRMVAEEYLSYFNFSGLTIDQAIRAFLREFALMGETQERERVLAHFSRRYLQCNPNAIPSEDSVHTLTCALMLLNTDLHGHALYNSIRNEKLQWTIDEEELRKSFSELADLRTDSASHTMKRIGSGLGVAQNPDALIYKNGFLVRKVHADSDGKKTPRGKRGWKTFYVMLKGLVLYLQKGEYRPEKQLSEEDLKNAVSIHHSLAMRAADYSKRPNVFYLRTADWRVFLFQAPNSEQMQSWITRINVVSAMFSAPPFPAAIGSQKKFSRPLLPGSNSKLSQEEQVKSHETRFRAISSELIELTAVIPDKKAKVRDLEEHKQREEYLEFEKTRYGTYAMLLRSKIRSGEEDLSLFESRLFDDGGLQRAHSSPTLREEHSSSSQASSTRGGGSSSSQASSAKGGASSSSSSTRGSSKTKRSEPQRHSYRQAVKQ